MQAIILAAGQGTRLWPLSELRPKVMIPIGNKPILEHIVESLVKNGINEIIMVVGYRRGMVQAYFGDGSEYGVSISYAVQSKPLGTAHALVAAQGLIKDDFIILPGDNIISPEGIRDILEAGPGNSALLTRSLTPPKYGAVEMVDGLVKNIIEKPATWGSGIISTGIFRLQRHILTTIAQEVSRGNTSLVDALGELSSLSMKAIITTGYWYDVVYPWDVIEMSSHSINIDGQEINGILESNVSIRGPVRIGEGTRIRSGCNIEGPVIIGKGCDIGPNVVISPASSIGDNVTISPFCHISASVIMSGSNLGSHAYLGRSLVDSNVRIGPHFCSAGGDCQCCVQSELISLKNMGAVIGSNSTIGGGVNLKPGIIIGNGCSIHDGAKVIENVRDQSEVY
ncbi:MAG TPA: NTP transferase domain-containing protein [Candidatus Methanomethylophilaceae archaeon]|nr:NTP transferase domain-containing protein [Candidatus Methanomethylophilaceae archaeon]